MCVICDEIWDIEPLSDEGESRDTTLVEPLDNCLQEHRETHTDTALSKPILADALSAVQEDENKRKIRNVGHRGRTSSLMIFVRNLP
jgi:hypothetical protein